MEARVLVAVMALAVAGCKKEPPAPAPAPAKAAAAQPKAEAPIAKPRQLSREEARRFRAAMADGRKLGRAGDHAGAVAAFDRALAVQPDDPGALSELGWEAFLGRSLDRAEAATRRAVAAATEPRLKAASLYNLGRVLEERGRRDAAAAAYAESLHARPSRTVREQLAKIDPAAAAAADPLKPVPLAGPFPSLAAFCDSLPDEADHDRAACPNVEDTPNGVVEDPEAPWLEARYFRDADQMTCHLAVRVAAGWFADRDGFYCHDNFSELEQEEFALADLVPGGAKELVLKVALSRYQRDDVELEDDSGGKFTGRATVCQGRDEETTVCGVGASGRPTCFSMQSAEAKGCSGADAEWTWQLAAAFTGGQLDVRATGKPNADAKALTGQRPFVFP